MNFTEQQKNHPMSNPAHLNLDAGHSLTELEDNGTVGFEYLHIWVIQDGNNRYIDFS